MTGEEEARPPGFWRVAWLLLASARRRQLAKIRRKRELRSNKAGKDDVGLFGFFALIGILVAANFHFFGFLAITGATEAGHTIDLRKDGSIIVSGWFDKQVEKLGGVPADSKTISEKIGDTGIRDEANHNAQNNGSTSEEMESRIRKALANGEEKIFVTEHQSIASLGDANSFSALFGSLVFFCWLAMMVFQGESSNLDMQRSRDPMWEWLFSHPVKPAGVFFAELLAPMAANPLYITAPVFIGFLFGWAYGGGEGVLAAFLAGLPVTMAASCLGKSLEIWAFLRLSPKSRGAVIGLMSWVSYTAQFLLLILAFSSFKKSEIILEHGEILRPLTMIPWPWLGWVLGVGADGTASFANGVVTTIGASIVVGCAAVAFSVWCTNRGLAGSFGRAAIKPRAESKGRALFGRDPLYRKEMLWFMRDRSAIIQTLLLPLTVAAMQLFNMRALLVDAQLAWNYLCGAAILFGTYFLFVLGPRSLASEGAALWIPLTWPRGMESLLKAKAWMWTCISSAMVSVVFLYAMYVFPSQSWKIVLVAIAWFIFAKSMAEKAVTLVTVTLDSGEQEKAPMLFRFAAKIGMLSFSIGVLTQQWNLGIIGIVFSCLTSAAMWEAFRARLPHLYDPWSEKLPTPPTLFHAMVAISLLIELSIVLTPIISALTGIRNSMMPQVMASGISLVAVSLGFHHFLLKRGVSSKTLWTWPSFQEAEIRSWKRISSGILFGVIVGGFLGVFAVGYTLFLEQFPFLAEILKQGREAPDWRLWVGILAIGLAPFAEEFLFRGVLYRALDREWGGWAAILGSAAFFAIFHSPLFWIPVGLLGVLNAYLFKKTGHLAVPIALHMAYNAVVVML